jgi:hypothetical protein
MAFWKGKVVRRSFWLLASCRASKEALKEGEMREMRVRREWALAFLGIVLGKGSKRLLEDLFTKKPET